MPWVYAEVEDALARMCRVPPDVQKKAFRGKIQHFQKLGIPLNLKPGKGRKNLYTEDELFQWALCLELAEYGVHPSTIADTIRAYWKSHLLPAFRAASQNETPKDDILVCFSPHLVPDHPGRWGDGEPKGLGEPKILQGEEAFRRAPLKVVHVKRVDLPHLSSAGVGVAYMPAAARSAMIINLSQIIRDLRQLRFLLDVGAVTAAVVGAFPPPRSREQQQPQTEEGT
jgi:hypothetical protein